MNTTHKIAGAFAAVLAVIALGGTLQAAVADSTRPGVTQSADTDSTVRDIMLHRNDGAERTGTVTVAG
jgi:hypothetical protein